MKCKIRLMLMLSVLTFSVTGCSDNDQDDNTQQAADRPLVLQGQAYTFNTEEGTVWHNAQEIGVFLTETGQETVCGDYANLKFYADNRNSYGYFVPNGDPIYLDEEQTVDIKAYYPYKIFSSRAQDTYYYTVDLSNQKTAKPDGFLYADNAKGVSRVNYKANLELRPVLSLVKLTLVPGADITEDRMKKMTARLKGMKATAQFDLLKGEFLKTAGAGNDVKIALNVKSDLTISIVMFPEEMSEHATLEVTLPAEGDKEELTMSWSLNNAVQSMEQNVQYDVLVKLADNGMTGELIGKSFIYIQDWGHSDDVNGDANQDKGTEPEQPEQPEQPEEPEKAGLVTDGSFEKVSKIGVAGSLPAATNVWYGLKNNDDFLAEVVNDDKQGKVAHWRCTAASQAWHKNYLGHRANGAKSGSYRLSFKAYTKGAAEKNNLQVYIRINKSGNAFFVLKDVDLTKACAAKMVAVTDSWAEYTVDFDFTTQVNTIWNSGITTSATAATDFADFYIAFVASVADTDYYLDDVKLEEL